MQWVSLVCLLVGVSFTSYSQHSRYPKMWGTIGGSLLGVAHALIWNRL